MEQITIEEQDNHTNHEGTAREAVNKRFYHRKFKTRCVLVCGIVAALAMVTAALVAFIIGAKGYGSEYTGAVTGLLTSTCPRNGDILNVCDTSTTKNGVFYIDTFLAPGSTTGCKCDMSSLGSLNIEILTFSAAAEASCSSEIQLPETGKTYQCPTSTDTFTHTSTNSSSGLLTLAFTKRANNAASYCVKITPSNTGTVKCRIQETAHTSSESTTKESTTDGATTTQPATTVSTTTQPTTTVSVATQHTTTQPTTPESATTLSTTIESTTTESTTTQPSSTESTTTVSTTTQPTTTEATTSVSTTTQPTTTEATTTVSTTTQPTTTEAATTVSTTTQPTTTELTTTEPPQTTTKKTLTSACPTGVEILNVCGASASRQNVVYLDTFLAGASTNCECGLTSWVAATLDVLPYASTVESCTSSIKFTGTLLGEKIYNCSTSVDSFTHNPEGKLTLTFTKEANTEISYCVKLDPKDYWSIDCKSV